MSQVSKPHKELRRCAAVFERMNELVLIRSNLTGYLSTFAALYILNELISYCTHTERERERERERDGQLGANL